MTKPRRLLAEQAAVLVAAVLPLALAEGAWWYLAAVLLAIGIGAWRAARDRGPLLGPVGSRLFVLLAFALLLIEYEWRGVIPVVALSHFMVLVCASKFLQEHTLRDDAQFAVLCLLLLVVAAIVSGSIVFLLVLVAYLSLGLDVLLRFNASLERARVQRANAAIFPAAGAAAAPVPAGRSAVGATLLMSLTGLTVGLMVFAFFPRIGAGMFGRPELRPGGLGATGFTSSLDFGTIGPIAESDRQVMRVIIESPDGPAPTGNTALYLRGRVYDFYGGRGPFARGWEWQNFDRPPVQIHELTGPSDREISLLPEDAALEADPMLIQRYTLEPGAINDSVLFALYPPVAVSGISPDQLEVLTKSREDQTLEQSQRPGRPAHRLLRYTVRSVAALTPAASAALEAERKAARLGPPRPHRPDPPLRDEHAILARMQEQLKDVGPLDDPQNRRAFAEQVQAWLRSGEFTYTLSPPPLPSRTEHVGHFLLRGKRGHCQHFASAMAIICQLAGVPAHVVTGFRCDDYNPLGGFWSVRGRHAHAWVEVYIPGAGWVPYDPTPFAAGYRARSDAWLQKLRGCADYLQFEWSNFVLTYDAQVRRDLLKRFETWLLRPARSESTLVGMVAAFVYELFAWRMEMSWHDRLLYWGFALLIVALTVLVGYVVAVLCWRAGAWVARLPLYNRPRPGRSSDVLFYHRLCRRLSALGLRRRPEQTPAEFAADLAARFPVLQPAADLVSAYYGVVYGGQALSAQRRADFESFLRQLHGLDRATLGET